MTMRLEGKSGIPAEVNIRNLLWTYGVAVSEQFWVTYKDNFTWTVATTQTPAAPNDYVVYVRNTSSVRDLMITNIEFQSTVAEAILVNGVTGTPAGGTALVPYNRTLASSRAPLAVIEGAATITGLTTIGTFERILQTAIFPESRPLMTRPIYLPRQENQTNGVGFQAENGAGAVVSIQFDLMIRSADVESLV